MPGAFLERFRFSRHRYIHRFKIFSRLLVSFASLAELLDIIAI